MKNIPGFIHHQKAQGRGTALLLLALVTAALAQTVLLLAPSDDPIFWNITLWLSNPGNNNSPLPGLGLYLLAGILLVLGLRKRSSKQSGDGSKTGELPRLEIETARQAHQPPRFGFWLTSAGLAALIAIYTSRPQFDNENGYALTGLWILSVALFSYSILRQTGWQMPGLSSIRAWLAGNRDEVIIFIGLLVLSLFLRLLNLELHPYPMVNDEGEMGKVALCLLDGECRNLFALNWAAQPVAAYLPYALSITLFGNETAFPIRLVTALAGTLGVAFTYLFVREAFDKTIALVAGTLLATFPYHLHFSRLGVDNFDALLSAALLWLLFRGLRKGTAIYFLLAGIVAALCFYTYAGSRLSAGIGVGAIGYAILTRRGLLRAQASNLLIFAAAALITITPLLGTYVAYPGEFNARLKDVGLFQTGIIQTDIKTTGLSAAQILTRQFFKSSLPYIAAPAPDGFFDSPRAYFSPPGAIFLMLGLVMALRKPFGLLNITLLAWFFAPIILGSTITASAPASQRMLGSIPAAIILAALALVTFARSLGSEHGLVRRAVPLVIIVVIAFNGFLDINYYFGEYRTGHYFADLSNEITYESRTYIARLENEDRLYLIGQPLSYVAFGNFHYFNHKIQKYDFNEVTLESLAALPKDQDALFLSIPEREQDLRRLAEWLPGGEWIEEKRRYLSDQPLFFAYTVSREQWQAFQP